MPLLLIDEVAPLLALELAPTLEVVPALNEPLDDPVEPPEAELSPAELLLTAVTREALDVAADEIDPAPELLADELTSPALEAVDPLVDDPTRLKPLVLPVEALRVEVAERVAAVDEALDEHPAKVANNTAEPTAAPPDMPDHSGER